MTKPTTDFFTADAAKGYDERNSRLAAIQQCMHFLTRLILKDLPVRSRILSVGAGTGAEILSLAQVFPEWTFVALDPSLSMLDVCRQRIKDAGLTSRCEFVHGLIEDLPARVEFDSALSILVAHFIKRQDRPAYFQNISNRLKPNGILVNAEISFDLDSPEFPQALETWEAVQELMGGTPESLAKLPQILKEMLTVLPPADAEDLIRKNGFALPVRFFQAFMICAWYARRAT